MVVKQQNTVETISSELSELPSSDSDGCHTIVIPPQYRSPANRSFESSMSSSSHRVERYGEVLITASDEEDSDELLDLDQLLNRKPIQLKLLPVSKDQERTSRKLLKRDSKPKYVDTSRDDEAKFNKLMEQTKKDLIKYDDYKEAVQVVKQLDRNQSEATDPVQKNQEDRGITADRIMTRVGELDSEKAEKFAQALDRTELVHGQQIWSFFDTNISRDESKHQIDSVSSISRNQDDSTSDCIKCNTRGTDIIVISDDEEESSTSICKTCERSGPGSSSISPAKTSTSNLIDTQWPEFKHRPGWSIYKNVAQRELAFLGGVFEQAAAHGQLPDQLYLWILQQSFHEPREDLRQSYRTILKYSEKSISSSQAFNCIQNSLKELGASDEAISVSAPIIKVSADPSHVPQLSVSRDLLVAWLQNVGTLSNHLHVVDGIKVLHWLLVLTLDSAIPFDTPILVELQHALENCIGSFDDTITGQAMVDGYIGCFFDKTGDVYSQLQSLNIFPITTEMVSRKRRRLAAASFFEDSALLELDPFLFEYDVLCTFLLNVKKHLDTNQQFQMNSKTDYRKVAALLSCLDIAIGDGNVPDTSDSIQVGRFNAAVDALIETVQVKFARIQANGAAHISRTETKDILEAMERRLRFAVRTEPKRKRGIYDQKRLDETFKKK